MKELPEPKFIETDQQAVLESCIQEYENLTGRTLYPAQSERLLINLIAYREHLVRVGIQEAAKQNLVRYANAPMPPFQTASVVIFVAGAKVKTGLGTQIF